MLQLREELAKLLGYNCYAEMSLANKMAKNVGSVLNLIDSLYDAASVRGRDELAVLTQFAHEKLSISGTLQPWDVGFVSEHYRKFSMGIDQEKVAKYLPFPRVISGMFSMAERLFDISVREVEPTSVGAPSVWNKDVKLYKVTRRDNAQPLAYFYGDFYSRPEEKRSGAWMDVCATRWKQDNGVRLPIAYLVCNQPAPLSNDKAATMKFSDVLTLFHEFGHCLQHMLTTVDAPQASGVSGIEWDFIEASVLFRRPCASDAVVASQFMENFCYEKDTLQQLSAHIDTYEPMPSSMIDALQEERKFLAGIAMLRQLQFSHVDLELHRIPVESDAEWPVMVDRRIGDRYALVERIPEDRFLCSFAHIFGGGYSAGYYSYKWSEMYSADAYAAFEGKHGIEREQVGQRYRDTVLALGGGTAPSDVWKAFRGRSEADPSALLRHSGLLA
ncbi:peptidase M3A/M3B [Thamnocephalis sphaerospora]|uniref:Peptidase M3A/M3B n=1 Tax=Thamnocephalis sphaerospora TaxID=78915 RepID=A0A4P9XWX1_9FUNG|nr:peptidase M3A/M3B [Thamnocephalis sphaerospora]|eukprot:RKP10492.1 peptidase M3A/M3B [Thamnocephalis sphaerospora]